MSDHTYQRGLFDDSDPPPPVHSDGHDTEFAARDKVAKGVSKWRKNVFDFVASAGARGVIPWDAIVHFEQQNHQSTVRTRFTELASEKHGAVITRTPSKRPNANGNMEGVYVVSPALVTENEVWDEIFGYEDPPETSEHFKHAVTYDLREVRGLVPPLAVGEPVPGCPCEDCTEISEDREEADEERHPRRA